MCVCVCVCVCGIVCFTVRTCVRMHLAQQGHLSTKRKKTKRMQSLGITDNDDNDYGGDDGGDDDDRYLGREQKGVGGIGARAALLAYMCHACSVPCALASVACEVQEVGQDVLDALRSVGTTLPDQLFLVVVRYPS